MFGALAEKSINIKLINTSEVRINVGADIASGQVALDCLRQVFAVNGD
jgi:aspartate kinase